MEGAPHRYHEDHIAGKGTNSSSHYNFVHKFSPMPQAMKIPDAKAAVEKNGKLKKLRAWQLTKVRNQKIVMDQELVQNGVMDGKFVKNFVMDAKIDPKVVMDLSI